VTRPNGPTAGSLHPPTAGELDARARTLVRRRAAVLGPAYRLLYSRPLELVRGDGVYVYDADGVEYLDAYNNVPCVGHGNPRVVEAIAHQARTLNTNTRYLGEPILDYAERLLATHAPALDRVMFTCTGSEANDLALRVARWVTGATGVIVTANAYHGVTASVAELSPSLGPAVPLGTHVRAVRPPLPGDDGDEEQPGAAFARRVRAAVADLRRHGVSPAAVIIDSCFAADGLILGSPGLLTPVAQVTREAGALLIVDEVQPGFGRLGDSMWGYQRHGLEPDIVTMGKPMGNGMPIAGMAVRAELLDDFGLDARYFNTFAANSVSIAAATAVLDVIEADGLLAHAKEVGRHLLRGMEQLAAGRPRLQHVRGAGLFAAVDFMDRDGLGPDRALATRVVDGLRDRGVLTSVAGAGANALKVRPPLPFDLTNTNTLLERAEDVLSGMDVELA
jgi:4-aminobutyrate aminotransferase-like enzyme